MRDRVAGFKRPRAFHIREQDLPKSGAGKLLRRTRARRDQGASSHEQ